MPDEPINRLKNIQDNIYQTHLKKLPEYGLLFFNHLHAEYTSQANEVKIAAELAILEEIVKCAGNKSLTWKDIYTYDLILARTLGGDKLRSKVLNLRSFYRSVAGPKDYDVYIASKPPDPLAPETTDAAMKQDCQFLLNQFYLQYAMTSAREHMRNNLLKIAAAIAILTIIAGVFITFINNKGWWGLGEGITTLSVVVFAGIVGAMVSMQQRIQASNGAGDPLHNFAVLTHGRFGIFLSPISGAIFATVLYLMFTGGLLKGTFFPQISTVDVPCAAPTPTPPTSQQSQQQQQNQTQQQQKNPSQQQATSEQQQQKNPAQQQQQATADQQQQKNLAQQQQATSEQQQQNQTQQQQPNQAQKEQQKPQSRSLLVFLNEFLKDTGPCGGDNYALLVIWAFIAGFAERLVPDALNRLVAKTGSQ